MIASYIATVIQILAEDSEDDTDNEDTPRPPTFTLQLFLDSLFFTGVAPVAGLIFETKNRAIFSGEFFSGEKFLEEHYCPYNFVPINFCGVDSFSPN